ncbi:hypothetical protein CEUSTIGMA_g11110.t1 [Chlamydomonas eustigma]|uniref:Ribosomal protein n=1 Tax=Chlamydomonas eustigma TaxID=1157962 RepID=A0A250XKR3_9CHLO|nr:hypothetical protein CEUSTIGMA_g11110.t1 [Chlamydomonas eustigma]|eukprot:GAX83685.1 hypothetical protein CEUSTIGMA_g11110.t1 [Chlamydomonas eustigma]
MKVRGKVKLLCSSCNIVKVQITRDMGYMEVHCSKNPRHKQRTKWPSPQKRKYSDLPGMHSNRGGGSASGLSFPATQVETSSISASDSSRQSRAQPASSQQQVHYLSQNKAEGTALQCPHMFLQKSLLQRLDGYSACNLFLSYSLS